MKVAAGQDVELELAEGALLLEELGDGAARGARTASGCRRRRRPRAARAAPSTCGWTRRATTRWWRSSPGCRTPACRRRGRTRCGSTGRWPPTRPGTSCSRAPSAASGARRSTSRTSRTSASTSSTCRPSTRSASPTARAATTRLTPAADDPGSPWAIGSAEGGHDAVHPELGTLEDFDAFVAARRRARPRDRPRLRAAVQPRPPLGARPPRVVHPATRRLDPLRREPAEEVPGHPPDQLLAGRRRRPRRPLGGVPRRPRALDRPRRPHVPGRQPAHQAAGVLGVDDRRRPRAATPTSCSSPRRSPTPPMMAKLAEVGFTPELHVLHLAARRPGSCASTSPSSRRARWRTYMRPSFWPNTPDILDDPLRARAAGRLRAAVRAGRHPRAALRHLLRLRAGARTSRPTTPPPSTATRRSTRSRRATTTQPHSLAPLIRSGQRDPPAPPGVWSLSRRPLPPQRRRALPRLQPRPRRHRPAPRRREPRPAPGPRHDRAPRPRRRRPPDRPPLHAARRAVRRHLRVGRPVRLRAPRPDRRARSPTSSTSPADVCGRSDRMAAVIAADVVCQPGAVTNGHRPGG